MKHRALLALFLLFAAALPFAALPSRPARAQTPPPTCTLSASTGAVQVGQTVNLTWRSSGATQGNITSIGSVAVSGTQGVIPTPPSTTYTGTFFGPGGTGQCSIIISVSTSGAGGGSGTVETPGLLNAVTPTVQTPSTGGAVTPTPTTQGAPSVLVSCSGLNCQACNLAQLGQNIINFLVGLSLPIAAAMFAFAGVLYFSSSVIDQIDRAKRIFMTVFKGFLLVIGAWLVIQTLLYATLNGGASTNPNGQNFYQSWNKIQCVNNRTTDAPISSLFSSFFPNLPSNYSGTPISGGGGNSLVVGNNSVLRPDVGSTMLDPDTGAYANNAAAGPLGSCNAGDGYGQGEGTALCVNANGDTYAPTPYLSGFGGSAPSKYGGITCDGGQCSSITAALAAYVGSDTSMGPDGGNKACAWAVNNILVSSGYQPIDGDSVYYMEQQLQSGRGTQESQSNAHAGDIVIFGGMSHVGICYDPNGGDGCPVVRSNSSSNASFTSLYPPTSGSRFYKVN